MCLKRSKQSVLQNHFSFYLEIADFLVLFIKQADDRCLNYNATAFLVKFSNQFQSVMDRGGLGGGDYHSEFDSDAESLSGKAKRKRLVR